MWEIHMHIFSIPDNLIDNQADRIASLLRRHGFKLTAHLLNHIPQHFKLVVLKSAVPDEQFLGDPSRLLFSRSSWAKGFVLPAHPTGLSSRIRYTGKISLMILRSI